MDEQNQQTLPPQQPPLPPQNVNPVPPPQQSYYGKRNWLKWILIYLIIAVLIYGGIYYFFLSKKGLNPYSNPYSQLPTITPSPTPTPNPTANWKTYTTSKLTFKYPPNFMVEEREKDFFVIVPSGKKGLAPQEGIAIDARLLGNNASFDQAVNSTKQDLINIKQENIVNGIKISGVMGPGMGEGLPVISVLLQYKNGAIVVEPDQNTQPEFLDQILSTFKLLDQKASTIEVIPKITGIERADTTIQGDIGYRIITSSFPKQMWLCVQPDWYSKPSNKRCNSGILLDSPDTKVFMLKGNFAVLRLYSDNELTQLYDEVLVQELNKEKSKITRLQEKCGKLIQNKQSGNFFIKDTRLLTVPGWTDLIKFINEEVCVQGELYTQTSSLRVYFIVKVYMNQK